MNTSNSMTATSSQKLYQMVVAALLCAVGIIIPMFSPIKVVVDPMSFTLASHVAIFIAMFISLPVGVAVGLGTTIGFFLGGFPIAVVLRALSHIIFVAIGAAYLQKNPDIMNFTVDIKDRTKKLLTLAVVLSVVHALCEVFVVIPFYFGTGMSTSEMVRIIALLVGVGSFVHSMVDFAISLVIWKPLSRVLRTK